MPTYTIVIKNHSGSNQNYLLFQAPPLKANPIGQVWSNVLVKTDGTPSPNGKQVITVTEDLFAFAGTTPKSLADGVTVSESDYAGPVTLANGSVGGTKPTVSIVNDNPAFGPKPYSTTNKPNSFGITVKPYYVGAYRKCKFWITHKLKSLTYLQHTWLLAWANTTLAWRSCQR